MRIAAVSLWIAGAFMGFAAGLLSVERAHAQTTYTIDLMGGAASPEYIPPPTPNMRCGWHTSCWSGQETAGVSLDWAPYGNHAFYFRSFMYRSSGPEATVATGTVEVATGQSCKTVWVHISANNTYRGTAIYLHVSSTAGGAQINIKANTSGYWTQSQVGSTVGTDNPGCMTGEHLHQRAYWEPPAATGSRNTAVYPNYVNPGRYYIDRRGYHQDRGQWSY